MSSVADILTTVKNLALVGDGGASDDATILLYMNNVYSEIYRETAQAYPSLVMTTESVVLSSGVGTLTSTPFTIFSVKDESNNNFLDATTLLELEADNPALTGTGNPTKYYQSGFAGIVAYPTNSATLQVRYASQAATLTSTSLETDIKIPAMYHDILLWGTLVYMAYDERDGGISSEFAIAQGKYDKTLTQYREWLYTGQAREVIRTTPILA